MASLMKKASSASGLTCRRVLPASTRPLTVRPRTCLRASNDRNITQVGTGLALASVAANWMMAGNASAATELAQLAASDNRLGLIATLFVPALGWVAFNIAQPLNSQLSRMDDMKSSLATAVGLGAAASLFLADQANAAEVATVAASDGRLGTIALLFVPALGWVAYNIAQPLTSQLSRMDELKSGFATAVGLGAAATLFLADSASASTEVATVAANDGRLGLIATLFVPALGWVAYNIASPLKSQLDRMDNMKTGFATAVGLGAAASLFFADNANAASEIASLAANDGRLGLIATLFVPALGWVAYNIAQPLSSQLSRMDEMK